MCTQHNQEEIKESMTKDTGNSVSLKPNLEELREHKKEAQAELSRGKSIINGSN